jgi:hypothetical protein
VILKAQSANDGNAVMSRVAAWFLAFIGFTVLGFLNFANGR